MFPRLLLILLTFSATCAALGFERPHYWGYGAIDIAALPQEAQFTLALIKRGGPFPYRKDGATFQNRERLLPKRARGYYREYTVRTPGSSDRGGRRIVAGEDGELYYTDDHYRTFRRIRE
jgi:ribonuclease T1